MKEYGSMGVWGYRSMCGKHTPPTRPHTHTLTHILGVLLIISLLLASCGRKPRSIPEQGPLSASITLSTNMLHVGDIVIADVIVSHPTDGQVQLPEPGREKEIVVRSREWDTREIADGRSETSVRYTLTSLQVGEHLLTTGSVRCVISEKETLEAPFPDATLTVESLLPSGDMELRDIKDASSWPGQMPRWLWALLIIATLAVVAALAVGRVLSMPRTILHHPPPPPAHEVARRALRRLQEKQLIEQGQVEPFYVELSNIARLYLENRFELLAPEWTTEEFIRAAATSRLLSPDHQQLTRDFLEQSDLVKFARHEPASEDMRHAFSAAERLVEETIPVQETMEEAS